MTDKKSPLPPPSSFSKTGPSSYTAAGLPVTLERERRETGSTTAGSTAPEPLSLPGVPRPQFGSRASFPQLTFDAYLAHAAISPVSLAVSSAGEAYLRCLSERGAESFPLYHAQRERLRASLAALLDASPGDIALTPGTTRGLTDLALALPLSEGSTIATFAGEFPANVTPWQQAARGTGATVRLLRMPDLTSDDPGDSILSEVEKVLSHGAQWLVVSEVQFQSGFRMPTTAMGQICRSYGAHLLVDGIQACGVVPVRPKEILADAFVVGAHKWMLGMEGAGFSYVSHDLMEKLTPRTAGWLSHEDGDWFLFRGQGHLRYDRPLKTTAQVFEGSTANAIGYAGLEAGLAMIRALDPQKIFDHVQLYHDALEPELSALGLRSLRAKHPMYRSGILSFVAPENVDVAELAKRLRASGVMISIPDGLVRIAPHFANGLEEIPLVVSAFRGALGDRGALGKG